jgi:hypothetical protein
MRNRKEDVNDSDESLSETMSDQQLEELEAEVSPPPSHKPTPTPSSKRKKIQVKHARKSAEIIADESVDESVDKKRPTKAATKPGKAKSKSVSIDIDDGEVAGADDESKPTTRKTPARSKRGVATVIDKPKKPSTSADFSTKDSNPLRRYHRHQKKRDDPTDDNQDQQGSRSFLRGGGDVGGLSGKTSYSERRAEFEEGAEGY